MNFGAAAAQRHYSAFHAAAGPTGAAPSPATATVRNRGSRSSHGGRNNRLAVRDGATMRNSVRHIVDIADNPKGMTSSLLERPTWSCHTSQRRRISSQSARPEVCSPEQLPPASVPLPAYFNFDGEKEADANPVAELFKLLRREEHALRAPSAELVANLCRRLGSVRPEDLCVGPEDVARISSASGLGYQEVHSGANLTACIFLMRGGACIPLHDHPGMNVFGRLLFGKMREVSFDMDPRCPGLPAPSGSRWGLLHSDETMGPGPATFSLGPDVGNIHELHALEDCAFFDIMSPPYESRDGRHCTYYTCEVDTGNGQYLLTPTLPPRGFSMTTLEYRGPVFDQ